MNRFNNLRLFARFLFSLCAAFAVATTSSMAQSTLYAQAVQTFDGGAYPQAASLFIQVLRETPGNQLAHYYLGISRHCMGDLPETLAEYRWVKANSTDPELLKRADKGIQVLTRVQQTAPPVTAPTANYEAAQPPSGYLPAGRPEAQPFPTNPPSASPTGWLSQAGAQKALQANAGLANAVYPGPAAPTDPDKPQILDVYTAWCGWCKVFEPIFAQAQAKYANQFNFQRINAEVKANKAIVKKYKVKGYPTILLLDSRGGLIRKIDGAPPTLAAFEQEIWIAFPAVKPF